MSVSADLSVVARADGSVSIRLKTSAPFTYVDLLSLVTRLGLDQRPAKGGEER